MYSAIGGCAAGQHGGGSTTGQSARPCRSARPRKRPGSGRCRPSGLESAVELRLGKKRAGRLEDLIGPAQFLVLALQLLEVFALAGRQPIALAGIDFLALDPFMQGLGHAANFGGDGFNGRPQRGVLASVLLHHAHSAFPDLG